MSGRGLGAVSALDREDSMPRRDILPWLVEFLRTDVRALEEGPPGNPPNLLYKLRIWLGLEPSETLNAEVAVLQDDPKKPAAVVSSILKLLDAVGDRARFEVSYQPGQ